MGPLKFSEGRSAYFLTELKKIIFLATMASQTQGIQQLLTAEKRAAEKVSEARKRKNRRLKQAKEEAQAEIEKYKAERETIFKSNESKFAQMPKLELLPWILRSAPTKLQFLGG